LLTVVVPHPRDRSGIRLGHAPHRTFLPEAVSGPRPADRAASTTRSDDRYPAQRADEERDKLRPLVSRIAVNANAPKAPVASLAAVRDRTVHTSVTPSEAETPD